MVWKLLRQTVALSAALGVIAPGAAYAQLGDLLGDTLDTVGGVVDGATGVVGGVVDGATGVVGGVVNGATGTVGDILGSGSQQQQQQALPQVMTLDQDAALDAVSNNRALPLEQIIAIALHQIGGEVLDAHLITVQGFLLYELKMVDADGDVGDFYFYARSGERVQTN